MLSSRPAILDIEASGLGAHSYPIEIGVVLADGSKFCALLSPDPAWSHWDPSAEALHGITRDLLATHGRALADVAHELNEFLGPRTLYSDGWVVDSPWLNAFYFAARVERIFRLSPLETILSEAQMMIWGEEKRRVLEQFTAARHRASFDAFIIQETYCRTRDRLAAGAD
jgi:hypothetical protein